MINKNYILISGGGNSRVLGDLAVSLGGQILGYFDLEKNGLNQYKYLGNDSDAEKYLDYSPNALLGYSYSGKKILDPLRIVLMEKYLKMGFNFPNLISTNSTILSSFNSIGTYVYHCVFINSNVRVGDYCLVNNGAIIEHDVSIGNNVQIGPGTIICGDCAIGSNVYIGAGTVIRDSIKICDEVVIGAGSTVIKDINNSGTFVGSPTRRIKDCRH